MADSYRLLRGDRGGASMPVAGRTTVAWFAALTTLLGATQHTAAALLRAGSSETTASPRCATYPPLNLVESALRTTAPQDFEGHHGAFATAHEWQREQLLASDADKPAPYLACADYKDGRHARSTLEQAFSVSGVHTVSHTEDHGSCFVATASPTAAEAMLKDPTAFGVKIAGPFVSTLKLAPGLLDHGSEHDSRISPTQQLRTVHGENMKLDGVHGLSIRLSPGVMTARDPATHVLIKDWRAGLMSASLDMYASSYWSDPGLLEGENGHLAHPGGAARAREWTRAADVVHGSIAMESGSVGEACGWDQVFMHPTDDGVLAVTGMDHLLPNGERSETQMACFMGLLSHLTSKPEVLRVSPLQRARPHNGVAGAIVQSANIAGTPIHDAGLDGSGEVIQIIDTGLDETSCYFVDEDGLEVEHGYYFEGVRYVNGLPYPVEGSTNSYPYDISRRKIVQIVDLFKTADPTSGERPTSDSFVYWSEYSPPSSSTGGFDEDKIDGHGTHTAGSAAGSTYTDYTITCLDGYIRGCVGQCITVDKASTAIANDQLDLDTYCPYYGCDGNGKTSPNCLTDAYMDNLNQNAGIAPGAKLSVFDVSVNGENMWGHLAGNGLWTVTLGTGSLLHSNSWGSDSLCELSESEILYDTFMYENPDHLLLFSAGNDGGYKDSARDVCTIGTPALGKNSLTVGATSSGPTRSPETMDDGRLRYEARGYYGYTADGSPYIEDNPDMGLPSTSTVGASIDTVAFFSSYGPTLDQRIKPEVLAPGDKVFSASSDGSDSNSCRLEAYSGTSMSCPIVAGSAALVRQYFTDATFYEYDVGARGLCVQNSHFTCQAFSPSASTVKAMLINSAHLLGGSAQPDVVRGFGRVHLEAGMPLNGAGSSALFVSDSSITTISSLGRDVYTFVANGAAGEDLRATISWIDPPSTTLSGTQLINDLDLAVTSPDGSTTYYMWDSGPSKVNVNERVIVPAVDVVSGTWTVSVSAKELTTASQSYSLVVTGALTG